MTSPPTEITVVVLSPALVGVTGPDPLGPDLDVLVDAHGLPYIPRRRLAARLRDAAVTVSQAYPDDVASALSLFGEAGGAGAGRSVVVGHARLAAPVRAAVAGAAARDTDHRTPLPVRVTRACTITWQTTAVDIDGAPLPGSLRSVRGLVPGLVLTAPLHWPTPPTGSQLRTLARCCLALDQFGRAEDRDGGRVQCLLHESLGQTLVLAGLAERGAA